MDTQDLSHLVFKIQIDDYQYIILNSIAGFLEELIPKVGERFNQRFSRSIAPYIKKDGYIQKKGMGAITYLLIGIVLLVVLVVGLRRKGR